jgi:hypothetical protein
LNKFTAINAAKMAGTPLAINPSQSDASAILDEEDSYGRRFTQAIRQMPQMWERRFEDDKREGKSGP